MITKEQLKDWLKESERKEAERKIESYIDSIIQREVIDGKTTVLVPAGKWGKTCSEDTPFAKLWYNSDLSQENMIIVRQNILKKYEDNGFNVNLTYVDTGWNNNAIAVEFKDLDEMVKGE